MNLSTGRNRVLDPIERFSEIVFGLVGTGLAMVAISAVLVAVTIALGG
jgi:hypothetical protein